MGRTRSGCLALTVASVVAVGVLARVQPTALGSTGEAAAGAERAASVATLTTRDLRIAVVARRLDGGGTPTAEVSVGFARRVGASWRDLGERRVRETFFWNTVTGPRALCQLAIAAAGSSSSFRPYVTVRLLLSPSLGCGRMHRLPLPGR